MLVLPQHRSSEGAVLLCLGSFDGFRPAELERLIDVNVCFEGEKSYSFLQQGTLVHLVHFGASGLS